MELWKHLRINSSLQWKIIFWIHKYKDFVAFEGKSKQFNAVSTACHFWISNCNYFYFFRFKFTFTSHNLAWGLMCHFQLKMYKCPDQTNTRTGPKLEQDFQKPSSRLQVKRKQMQKLSMSKLNVKAENQKILQFDFPNS